MCQDSCEQSRALLLVSLQKHSISENLACRILVNLRQNCIEQHESAGRYRNKYFDDSMPIKKSVFWVTGLKILAKVGTHFSFLFSGKKT